MTHDRSNLWLSTVLLVVGLVCFAALFVQIAASGMAAQRVLMGCR